MERLHPKGVSFSCWKYIKGSGFHELTYVCGKGKGKLSNSVFKRAFQNSSNRPSEKKCKALFPWKVLERGTISHGRYMKRLPLLSKMEYKRVKLWTLGWSFPVQKFLEYIFCQCVVPDNIHTSPTEGILVGPPLPPWNFHFSFIFSL